MTPGAGRGVSRLRLPLALVGLVLLGGILVAMLSPNPQVNSYLDPANNSPTGAKALADILGERGATVVSVYTPANAVAAVRSAGRGASAVMLVITSPDLLTAGQRRMLARARADLFLVAPGPAAVAALAPEVLVKSHLGVSNLRPVQPACGLDAATLAGSADVAGYAYSVKPRSTGCYPVRGHPSLARYSTGGRTITVLGSGVPLSNAYLARDGNAALTLNLLSRHRRIVWLTPEPASAAAPVPVPGRAHGRAAPNLLPTGVSLLLVQLFVAVVLAAIWRARRLGPLITERLPVVVRASETVEGHARLYQARRARGRASSALRRAMIGRVLPALGLLRDAPPDAVTHTLAGRSRLSQEQVMALVYGPPPATDADLVRLARNLDDLEREVRSQ